MGTLTKKVFGLVAILIAVNAIVYLGFAFIMWDLHPVTWDGFIRFFFTSFLAVVDLAVMAAYLKVDL
mgnify:CR=1 FL=1